MTVTIDVNRQQLADICHAHDVVFLGLFGSTARGEARADSDIDLLVRFSTRKSLLSVLALQEQLEHVFHKRVDLVTEAALSPYLRDRILQTLQVVYAA